MPSGSTPKGGSLGIFRLGKSGESPTLLWVVGAGFPKSYRLSERKRFVLIATNEKMM